MAFLIIACTGSIAQLSAASEYGLGAITIYLIPALFFMAPSALISAELATGWEGGVFTWVREAFGDRLGFQAIWLQWIQSVALYPSGGFCRGITRLCLWRPYPGAERAIYRRNHSRDLLDCHPGRLPECQRPAGIFGLVLGTLIPAAALIILMVIWLAQGKPAAVPLQVSDIVPPYNGISSLVLIIGTFIAFAGLEVNAVHIRERRRDPGRNYPKGVALAVVIIFVMYVLGTIPIAVAVPTKQLDLDAGAAQAFVTYMTGLGWGLGGRVLSFLLAFGVARRLPRGSSGPAAACCWSVARVSCRSGSRPSTATTSRYRS